MSIFHYIASIIGTGLIALAGLLGVHPAITPVLGATVASSAPIFDTVLTQQLGTSDTTMYLKSVTDNQGNVLSGYQCFTVDVNTPSVEYLCGTISGTTVTGLVRNLSYVTGTTTYATPTNIHRVGADVRITDFPALTILSNILNGLDSIGTPIYYATHPCGSGTSSTTICDKNYIDNSIAAGGSPGSPTVAGIFLGSTALQAASSTGTGVYNTITYNRVLQAGNATDTPQASCASGYSSAGAGCTPIADLNGNVWKGVLGNLGIANVWSHLQTFTSGFFTTASSTVGGSSTTTAPFVINTVPLAFPSVVGASSTVWSNDGHGDLTNEYVGSLSSATTSASIAVPTTAGSTNSGTAYCVSPKTAIAGGIHFNTGGGALNTSQINNTFSAIIPEDSYQSATNAWTVVVMCGSNSGYSCASGATYQVYAICI